MDLALRISVWSLRIEPKLLFFLWRLCHRILPTIEGLNSRGMKLSTLCPICLRQLKTIKHILFTCTVARRIFMTLVLDLESIPHTHSTIAWRWIMNYRPQEGALWVLDWWRFWKSRNWVIFEKFQYSISALHRYLPFDQDKLFSSSPVAPLPHKSDTRSMHLIFIVESRFSLNPQTFYWTDSITGSILITVSFEIFFFWWKVSFENNNTRSGTNRPK
ncbi:hypothetical protein LINPERHAP2_LOCUS37275 [Linum perenne]